MLSKSLPLRLAFYVSLAITAVLIASGLFIANSIGERFHETLDEEMQELVLSSQSTVEAFNQQLETSAKNLSAVFGEMFRGSFSLDTDAEITVAGQTVPSILSDSQTIAGNYKEVDRFAELTGGAATIFVRRGEDFVRVVTSVKKQDGSRAIGTLLDRSSPAYKINLSGQPFTGKVTLFGQPFITNYTPLKDLSGNIIGIRFIGISFAEAITSIQDKLVRFKVGKEGHLFVLNTAKGDDYGTFIIHPTYKGSNISDSINKAAAETILGSPSGKLTYAFKSTPDTEWLTHFVSVPELNWIIGATMPMAEVTSAERWTSMTILYSTLVLIIIVIAVMIFVAGRVVGAPLEEAIAHVSLIAQGD